jgi:hypothetical protein
MLPPSVAGDAAAGETVSSARMRERLWTRTEERDVSRGEDPVPQYTPKT